ncbi:hypothetical protein pEaSNUABM29_00221 [Erwinia phage pEa_SNUABM_29]|nr:hypothetical protein pEaSNUABM29_00221 [Erwinia phage pEa_SNUABM_29]
MKIYIDLLDDEFREVFPAAMFNLKREVEDYVLPKMVDTPHHAGLIGMAYTQIAIEETMKLSRTIAEFSYSDEDNEDGFVQAKMGRFTVELKVDEAIENIEKNFDEENQVDHMLRYAGEEGKSLRAAYDGFNKAEFKPVFMTHVRKALRGLEAQIWEHITSRLKEILIVVEPMQNITVGKF